MMDPTNQLEAMIVTAETDQQRYIDAQERCHPTIRNSNDPQMLFAAEQQVRPEVDPNLELLVALVKFLGVHPYLSTVIGN